MISFVSLQEKYTFIKWKPTLHTTPLLSVLFKLQNPSFKIFTTIPKNLFPNQETTIFVEIFIGVPEKFKVQFLEEAVEFIESLDKKARKKVIYNIRKA